MLSLRDSMLPEPIIAMCQQAPCTYHCYACVSTIPVSSLICVSTLPVRIIAMCQNAPCTYDCCVSTLPVSLQCVSMLDPSIIGMCQHAPCNVSEGSLYHYMCQQAPCIIAMC